jgi:hypothetical protein
MGQGETITEILNYIPGMKGDMFIACTVRKQGEDGDILRLYKVAEASVNMVGE